MTKIDFYTGCSDKLKTACQLSHKAMQNGMRVLLHAPDQDTCSALDKLLWHYPNTAFIPHCRSSRPEAEDMPVLVDHASEPLPHCEILISLHSTCLPFFSRFERVIEIVGREDDDIRQGRERYGFYRDRGYEMRHFDLTNRTA
jgi:DNA polymerase III subunit chi